jgi:hypothetical protein
LLLGNVVSALMIAEPQGGATAETLAVDEMNHGSYRAMSDLAEQALAGKSQSWR